MIASRIVALVRSLRSWEVYWIWRVDSWEIGSDFRFNSGNPYHGYRFGPLFVRRFLR